MHIHSKFVPIRLSGSHGCHRCVHIGFRCYMASSLGNILNPHGCRGCKPCWGAAGGTPYRQWEISPCQPEQRNHLLYKTGVADSHRYILLQLIEGLEAGSAQSLVLPLAAGPCHPSLHTPYGCIPAANLSAGLCFVLLWWLRVLFCFVLMQHLQWNAEVLIREERSFRGFHCSGKKPNRRGKKWEHSRLMAREMKYLISKMLYVQGGLPQPPAFFLGRN